MLRIDDYIKAQIVRKAWNYNKFYQNGGHLTTCLIMSCLMNRVRAGWGSALEVLHNIPKYSAELNEPPEVVVEVWAPEFVRCSHEIEGIYDGSTKDLSNGGTYFCDLRKVETPFFKDVILGQPNLYMRVADMNSFAVYRKI